MASRRKREWAVRYGDGEIDEHVSLQHAQRTVRVVRRDIRDGLVDPDDYEPMEILSREVIITTSKWAVR